MKASAFLSEYSEKQSRSYKVMYSASWQAAKTGAKADFDAKADVELAYKKLHSDKALYEKLQALLAQRHELDPVTERALAVAELEFKENQLSPEMIKKLVDMSAGIEQLFNTYRGDYQGKRLSNNDLLDLLEKEIDSERRKEIWAALKQVGAAVAPDLIALAKVRNEAAQQLGYKNYWEMRIQLQEHDPVRVMQLFSELEKVTTKPFVAMKREMDSELAKRFKLKASEIQAWHYDNPFFQAAPPSDKVNLDDFYKGLKKEDIVRIAQKFYNDIGLSSDDIVERSDLYEREGKDQHAFCTDMDRSGDVRTLQNVRPKADSMDTMLHELGHAVYSKNIDRSLPFNLRDSAHTFTTEAIAMMFGALPSTPAWLIKYLGSDKALMEKVKKPIAEQRRREQLIFARWTLVMLNFEKALYENPEQDLNALWWDFVERFQKVPRPKGRNSADWAAKPHFTIAPVYYHNYMMGELFAAQLRQALAKMKATPMSGPVVGDYLKKAVFAPGMRYPWPQFVKEATGEELTARYFATELK